MKKKSLNASVFFFAAAGCFLLSAVLSFLDANYGMGAAHLALGLTEFFLGIAWQKKNKKQENDETP